MTTAGLAELPPAEHHGDMEGSPRTRTSVFHAEATVVLEKVRQSLTQVLTALGFSKGGELQRHLSLDNTLAYQISRIVGEDDLLAVGRSVPSKVGIERFCKSAGDQGAPANLVEEVLRSYGLFEELVRRHAGDRTTFQSLISGAAGLSEEWLSVDLQHRRNAFRALSHIAGVHAKARVVTNIVGPADGSRFNSAYVVGYVSLRTLRSVDRVRVHGCHLHQDVGGTLFSQPLASCADDGTNLIEQYSSNPAPQLLAERSESGSDIVVRTSLLEPEIGNVGVSTVLFGEKVRLPTSWNDEVRHFNHVVSVPVEVLIQDVIVAPGFMRGRPNLRVHLGNDRPIHATSDAQDILGDHQVRFLGKGSGCLETPHLPNYPAMMEQVAGELGYDIEDFDVWRLQIDFPVYHSSSRIWWKSPTD